MGPNGTWKYRVKWQKTASNPATSTAETGRPLWTPRFCYLQLVAGFEPGGGRGKRSDCQHGVLSLKAKGTEFVSAKGSSDSATRRLNDHWANGIESRHFDEWNPLKYKRFRGFHFFTTPITTPIHTPTGIWEPCKSLMNEVMRFAESERISVLTCPWKIKRSVSLEKHRTHLVNGLLIVVI